MSIVTVGLLGPIAVDTGAGMTVVPGARARRLLAALALDPGALRSSRALIDAVWGDDPPRSPQAALHTQVSRLRQNLPDGVLIAEPSGYRLQGTAVTTDVLRARDLLDVATPKALDEAVSLWRGTPGDDLDGDLADSVRSLADDLRRRLDARRAQVALDDGDAETARRIAAALCAADPLDEPAHLLHMRALAAAGRTGDALSVFARIRRALSEELGADPGAELAALHQSLLQGPTASASDEPSGQPRRPVPAARSIGLRAEPNPLLGRDDEIDTLRTALDVHRVVTVLGPGGAGKTRIAQAVARSVHADGREVDVIELASVRSDDDVLAAIASTLGVGENDVVATNRGRIPVGDLAARLADELAGRGALLVLDNCEQIVDGAARVVADLIAAVADLTVLTTSRSPLMIAGESTHRLRPLTIEETAVASSPAVDLFVARASAVRPDIVIDRAQVAELCAGLDGLPLAIELAAARARTLSVADIADLLSRRLASGRLSLLRSGDRTAPQRHRTLQAVIEWSWDLLDDDARALMRAVCRFPSGFSGDAARSVTSDVTGGAVAVDDALETVVNQSLLGVDEVDGHIRYRMLEMVREFGEEQLVAVGDGAAVDAAMVRWAIRGADEIYVRYDGGDDRGSLEEIAREGGNLVWILRRCLDPDAASRPVGALDAVVAVFPVVAASWVARGLHAEVRAFAPRVVSVLRTPPTTGPFDESVRERWLAALLMATGHLLMIRPDLRATARGMAAVRAAHRPSETMRRRADFAAAIMLGRSRLGALRTIVRGSTAQDQQVRAIALSLRSNVAENFGDLDAALRDSLAAQEIAATRGDSWILTMGATEIAGIHGQSGRYGQAVDCYRNALDGLASMGAVEESLQVRCYLAAALAGLGRLDEATAEYDQTSGGWKPGDPLPTGAPESVALMLIVAAELAWQRGDLSVAAEIALMTLRFVVGEHTETTADPSFLLTISAGMAVAASCGRAPEALAFVSALATMIGAHHPGGFEDLPQCGAAATAVGAALCAVRPGDPVGAHLLAAGIRVRGRRDHPALLRVVDDARGVSGLGEEEWADVTRAVGRTPRRRAALDIIATLTAITPASVGTPG
ncbi:BTAD domain-containing putative transcriptional regulator [Williamsia deligens]|uniref:BTAD domain-containing putative transcriptional regulator n=1 Tax=Williamsia deligens TaxID=321325 RepID=A0ABW3G7S2_9NOCA|nr:BTAD domain-containing putative transcriptional regulator [Williamsia deligens]MCP2194471.1 putative ATPase [Williamsia deligens]